MNIAALSEARVFSPARIAEALLTTQDEVARTLGLGRDALARKDRAATPKTQRRLREMVEILNRVEGRFGSPLMAYAWLRSEPLPGYGGLTAMALLREGRADAVMELIDAVDAGVHA
ncbi:MAG: antitoxin Xre/MbcA/ParS toxin-binding domain-containing protein [Paracoccaceae bacterium]